jgi:hypothetical protein
MSQMTERVVREVVAFEALPLEVRGSRRAVVRWSDGSVGEALRWYDDEVLVCEGDHGNSRLVSSRVEKQGVAQSARPWEGPIISGASTTLWTSLSLAPMPQATHSIVEPSS